MGLYQKLKEYACKTHYYSFDNNSLKVYGDNLSMEKKCEYCGKLHSVNTVTIGLDYIEKRQKGNPFNKHTYTLLEYKDGWVSYYSKEELDSWNKNKNDGDDDLTIDDIKHSMKAKDFMSWYVKQDEE